MGITQVNNGGKMSLGLYNTLQELILEVATRSQVEQAVEKKQRVRIYYDGDETVIAGYRNIEPYVLGLSKAGNPIVRSWQLNGVTDTETPGWKTFRLDRISSWNKIPSYFYAPISDRDRSAPVYNSTGDRSMTTIYKQAKF